MVRTKGKRTRLTFSEKFRALDILAEGSSNEDVISTFGVSARFLRKLKEDGSTLRKRLDLQTNLQKWETDRFGRHLELDRAVMEYVSRCRQLNFPVSLDIIRVRACMIKEKLLSDERIEGKQRECLNNFVASEGWCTRFITRYNLNSRVLHGQAGSVDAETAKAEMSAV